MKLVVYLHTFRTSMNITGFLIVFVPLVTSFNLISKNGL